MKLPLRFVIPAAFLAGSGLGYFALFPSLAREQESSLAEKNTPAEGRATGLKLVRGDNPDNQSLPSAKTLTGFLLKYAEFSPQEIKDELARLKKAEKDKKEFNYALYQATRYLYFKLAYQSPEDAKRLLEDKDFSEKDNYYSTLLDGWAQRDFQGASDYLREHKRKSQESSWAFESMAAGLAVKDMDKALKWISTLTQGEREVAINAMAALAPKQHPEKMAEFMTALTSRELASSSLTSTLSSNWATADWDSFKAWADTLKKEKKESVLANALSSLSDVDLAKATEEFKKLGKEDNTDLGRNIIYGMDYEERKKGKALDWVLENKDAFSDPAELISTSLSSSNLQSPEMTAKVLRIEDEKIRDSALSTMVNMQSFMTRDGFSDYETPPSFTDILALSEKIVDPQKRSYAAGNCINQWIRKDPDEARQWITEKSSLPDQERQKYLQACDERQKEKSAKSN